VSLGQRQTQAAEAVTPREELRTKRMLATISAMNRKLVRFGLIEPDIFRVAARGRT
jgi:hypothetical protein